MVNKDYAVIRKDEPIMDYVARMVDGKISITDMVNDNWDALSDKERENLGRANAYKLNHLPIVNDKDGNIVSVEDLPGSYFL
jgi:hypothetical protein